MNSYRDPDLDYEALFAGASIAPWDVEANPMLPLLSLEDPALYVSLHKQLIKGWRRAGVEALSEKHRRLFALDCAEHVLPIYEEICPGDLRPRQAVAVARRFDLGLATKEELKTANQSALAAREAVAGKGTKAAWEVADAAVAVTDTWVERGMSEASDAAVWAAKLHSPEPWSGEEMYWQEMTVKRYYALEHPEYREAAP